MIEINLYLCEHCNKKFFDISECEVHEKNGCECNSKIDWKTYTFMKTGRGFADLYYVNINPAILLENNINERDLCEMVGEYTEGGECSGWKVVLDSIRDGLACDVLSEWSPHPKIIETEKILKRFYL